MAALIAVTIHQGGTIMGKWVQWADKKQDTYTARDWPVCPCCSHAINHGTPADEPVFAVGVAGFSYDPFTKRDVAAWMHPDCHMKWDAEQQEIARQARQAGRP